MDKPKFDGLEIKIPKIKELPLRLKLKLKEYRRVYKITKKPGTDEFKAIVKVSGLGIILIGLIGFAIFLIVTLAGGI